MLNILFNPYKLHLHFDNFASLTDNIEIFILTYKRRRGASSFIMEKREDFKRVVEGINQLEQQLLSINEDAQKNERYAVEAEEQVEQYFARCLQAMAVRKGALLRELGVMVTTQSMFLLSLSLSLSPSVPLFTCL